MSKYVLVPIDRYIELENNENELLFLQACGVDNFDTGISRKEYCKENNLGEFDFFEEDIRHEIIEK